MDTTRGYVLFEEDDHKVIWLGWDEDVSSGAIQTNQYLIVNSGKGILLDPGGVHLFSRVVSVVSRFISLDDVESIFFSHQDPDVSSGIALWLGVTNAQVYIHDIWRRFVPHFGLVDQSRITPLNDDGGTIALGSVSLQLVPAHFLHSAANFSLYDPRSRILFSGDIGTAVFPEGKEYPEVDDFDTHTRLMKSFHQRAMGSNRAAARWLETCSRLDVSILAPQHGAMMRGELVKKFYDWFGNLNCGIDFFQSRAGV
ncbi:MBL fold metallo-hydrolase [Marispirochaeta sp.]|uniref:MBL fold metallo-hydrolase n=1 Tax=Marispirochaeta sp. TaxID=2038653 RepID=UPI0029C89D7A|nr:MBL fold metallo-hydrolase [Marispirochaeta sp.]